jgi:hypothetical protein
MRTCGGPRGENFGRDGGLGVEIFQKTGRRFFDERLE